MVHSASAEAHSIATMLLESLPSRITSCEDYFIIGSIDFNKQLADLELLLQRLRKHDFKASPKKTHIMYKRLQVFRFLVSRDDIYISLKSLIK